MSWTEPKTDWVSTDYINIEDINRIINNLYFLREYAIELYYTVSEYTEMATKSSYAEYMYAEEVNVIEANLEQLNTETYSLDIGDTQTYYANGNGFDYEELNRIESAELLIYKTLNGEDIARYRLPFRLGGQKGIRT